MLGMKEMTMKMKKGTKYEYWRYRYFWKFSEFEKTKSLSWQKENFKLGWPRSWKSEQSMNIGGVHIFKRFFKVQKCMCPNFKRRKHKVTLQLSHLLILIWSSFGDCTVKSSWPLHYDQSHNDVTIKSLCDSHLTAAVWIFHCGVIISVTLWSVSKKRRINVRKLRSVYRISEIRLWSLH